MKKSILLCFVAVLCYAMPSFGQADAINTFFKKYKEDDRFSSVYISAKMFSLLNGSDLDKKEKEVLSTLKGLRILSADSLDGMKYYEEAAQKLLLNDYEELMTADNSDSKVRFLIKTDGEIIRELLLLSGGEKSFSLISLIGNIDLEKIKDLPIDVEGLEDLETDPKRY